MDRDAVYKICKTQQLLSSESECQNMKLCAKNLEPLGVLPFTEWDFMFYN